MACTYSWDTPPELGPYISCVAGQIFGAVQMIFVAMAVILVLYLIFRTITQRDNQQAMQEIPKHWLYVIILAFLAIGAGGTMLNILLKFLGVGDFQHWLDIFNEFIRFEWID